MRSLAVLVAIATLVLFCAAASASVIGLDARHGAPDDDGNDTAGILATGDEFAALRTLLADEGHTVVALSSFETADLAAAGVASVWLNQPFLQNYSDGTTGDPATFGYSASEIAALMGFVGQGGGLVLLGEGGFGSEAVSGSGPGSFDGVANFNQLANAFDVSFATGATTENGGHTILALDGSHPVTTGIGSPGGPGICVDAQRQLTIGPGATDLTTLSGADDALAAATGSAGAGNVVVLSDSTLFKDDLVTTFNCNLEDLGNRDLAANIAGYTRGTPIPEPGTAALLGLGLVGLAMRRSSRRPLALAASLFIIGSGLAATPQSAHAACNPALPVDADCGAFSAPFADPVLLGLPSDDKCVEDGEGELSCKPAAGALVLLEDDRYLYWNALEGTENVEQTIVAEFGTVSVNDQSRLLSFGPGDAPSWSRPANNDGGSPDDNPDGIGPSDGVNNGADGALFCSDQVHLYDGRVLAAGGTDYYNENGAETVSEDTEVPVVFPAGGVELEGLKDARIFDPATDTWHTTDSMAYGRWYPTLVTLADSNVFVASGVTKLVKPVYPEAPFNSGRNVVQTETYDVCADTWSDNGALAEKSLPLFPRLHLLPNGHVYFNAAGQSFNPFGQGYDQSLWNLVSSYDPDTGEWTDLAVAGFNMQLSSAGLEGIATDLNPTNPAFPGTYLQDLAGSVLEDPAQLAELLDAEILDEIDDFLGIDLSDPATVASLTGQGFRGSTSSVMLPLRPDPSSGEYALAEFLTAGGIESSIVNPSPGQYTASTLSRIDSIDVTTTPASYATRLTGPLHAPRWYGTALLLPNGEVFMLSGADRDEVQTPGGGISVTIAELFDPVSETWSQLADQGNERTYHNTAVLMRDGRVLVGGHAPINTAYGAHTQIPGNSPQDGRDPSFQIYSPPYVFRGDRPEVASVSASTLGNGDSFTVATTLAPGTTFDHLILMRRTATTHLVDADQRGVVLPLVASEVPGAHVATIPAATVVPPGKYVLFANASDGSATIPSEGVAISIERASDCAPKSLPEPGATAGLAFGALAALGLARRRRA